MQLHQLLQLFRGPGAVQCKNFEIALATDAKVHPYGRHYHSIAIDNKQTVVLAMSPASSSLDFGGMASKVHPCDAATMSPSSRLSTATITTTNGTMKPAPPPKPRHLASEFTGTLNSDALKTYVRQQASSRISMATGGYTNTDTFRTSREYEDTLRGAHGKADGRLRAARASTDEYDDDAAAAWGTARQSPSPIHAKATLADLFAPITIPGADAMKSDGEGDVASTSTSSELDALPRQNGGVQAAWLSGVAKATMQEDEEQDAQVPTIKIKKSELASRPFGGDLTNSPLRRSQQHQRVKLSDPATSSSECGTVHSREPSILSRFSAFGDDDDDDELAGDLTQQSVGDPNTSADTSSDPTAHHIDSTPKKKWMHARDGSAFERASPRPPKESKLASVLRATPAVGAGLPTISDSVGSGLPTISDGMPALGPNGIVHSPPSQTTTSTTNIPTLLEPEQTTTTAPSVSNSNLSSRRREVQPGLGRQARALYAFDGESTGNELTLLAGQMFEILKEDAHAGWSLAAADQDGTWRKGLVPRGWWTYTLEFTASPLLNSNQPAGTVSLMVPMSRSQSASQYDHDAAQRRLTQIAAQEEKAPSHRPSGGVGQMSTRTEQSGAAVEILTRLKRHSSSSPSLSILPTLSLFSQPTQRESTSPPVSRILGRPSSSETALSASVSTMRNDADDSQTSADTPPTASSSTWRPPGLFGGRSYNRFSPFVLGGAEQYILAPCEDGQAEHDAATHADVSHTVVSGAYGGPAWKHNGLSMIVEVHSPSVHTDERGKEYTAYVVYTSYVFAAEEEMADTVDVLLDPYIRPEKESMTSSVYRRFNQFRWLATHLGKLHPTIMLSLPPIPTIDRGAGWTARFEAPFVERRRRHVQSWLSAIVRHPVLSNDAGLRYFLESEEDEGQAWLQGAQAAEQSTLVGRTGAATLTQLFAQTLHPMFNVDANEATLEGKRIAQFTEAYERTMGGDRSAGGATDIGILPTCANLRHAAANNSDAYRQVSLGVLRLITGADAPTASSVRAAGSSSPAAKSSFAPPRNGVLPPMGDVGRRGSSGATNEDRAWCWREGCHDCRRLTRAMQTTAEAFQVVADEHRAHADGALFALHDRLFTLSKTSQQQAALQDVHKSALSMYRLATGEPADERPNGTVDPTVAGSAAAERIAARCETVLNVTMSEMDRLHTQRVQDWNAFSRQMLDAQIDLYDGVLHHLRRARNRVDEELGVVEVQGATMASSTGPLLPSPYETQLRVPVVHAPLVMPDMRLLEPSAASKAIRPVAVAGEVLSDWLLR